MSFFFVLIRNLSWADDLIIDYQYVITALFWLMLASTATANANAGQTGFLCRNNRNVLN